MNYTRFLLVFSGIAPTALALAAVFSATGRAEGQPFEWQRATPESQGMSGKTLDALRNDLDAKKTKAFLVIRNDKIVYEWYALGHGPGKKHGAASLSKPTVVGLALALLLSDGKLKLDTLAADLVAAWTDDPR